MNNCFNMVGGGAGGRLSFSYTGTIIPPTYDEQGNWEFSLLDSGQLKFKRDPGRIDVFCVGGGAGGATKQQFNDNSDAAAGGGGGYTLTATGITIDKRVVYEIQIGAGGEVNADGGNTTAFGYTAEGGKKGTAYGGNGGNGGGGWGSDRPGDGGSDGNDGTSGQDLDGDLHDTTAGGKGQRNRQDSQETTTRAFRDANGKLFAGGGGGYCRRTQYVGKGGEGGGGDSGTAGETNMGGGGGAMARGGSGIVIIRNARGVTA